MLKYPIILAAIKFKAIATGGIKHPNKHKATKKKKLTKKKKTLIRHSKQTEQEKSLRFFSCFLIVRTAAGNEANNSKVREKLNPSHEQTTLHL